MTVTTVIVVALVSFVGGGAAGIAIKGNNDHKTLQAQAQSIDAILDGQTEILIEASDPDRGNEARRPRRRASCHPGGYPPSLREQPGRRPAESAVYAHGLLAVRTVICPAPRL